MLRTVAILIALTAPARAGGIVLESYTGERPPDANRLLSPILDELSTRGFGAGDTLARTYETSVSRPASAAGGLPADFAAQVDRGFKTWVAGKFDEAIKQLGPLVETAHANTGAFAKDQTLREPLLKAMIALALSQQRTGDPGAMRGTFGEILRSFPDTQLSRATYGPEAFDAFEQVRRDIAATGHGRLTVKVSDDAVVFVDEAYRAEGTTSADLIPGEYRVCVMLNKQPSRNHRVVVRAGAEVTLVVDAKLDQVAHTTAWTGFAFTSEADRDAHEPTYAAAFANAIGATAVAVIGIDQVRGRSSIVGSLVSLQTGHEIRRASVAVEPDPSTERLRALARFLAGDEPAAGLEVQLGAHTTTSVPSVPDEHHDEVTTPSHAWGGWKWITGVIGVGGLGVGGTLLVLDGRCATTQVAGRPCNDVYNTTKQGLGVLGVGAVFGAISIYLFATGHPDQPARTAYVAPAPGGAIAGYAMTW